MLYTIPLSLVVPSAPLLIVYDSVPSVTLCAYYIRVLVDYSISRKNQERNQPHIHIVKKNRNPKFYWCLIALELRLNWLAKGALLRSN